MTQRLNRADLKHAATLFELACQCSRSHSKLAQYALETYGDHGSTISGVVRDHFPEHIKTMLRDLAHMVTDYSDRAHKARPARVTHRTMRELGRDVATRDGDGFYGPRAR